MTERSVLVALLVSALVIGASAQSDGPIAITAAKAAQATRRTGEGTVRRAVGGEPVAVASR